jgi:hypothetical protein
LIPSHFIPSIAVLLIIFSIQFMFPFTERRHAFKMIIPINPDHDPVADLHNHTRGGRPHRTATPLLRLASLLGLCLSFGMPLQAGEPAPVTASDSKNANTPPARWQLDAPHRVITWNVQADTRLPHGDCIEMSGKRTAAILRYEIDARGQLSLGRTLIWPGLRVAPNNTHSSLKIRFRPHQPPQGPVELPDSGLNLFEPEIRVNGNSITPRVTQARFENGLLIFTSSIQEGLILEQTLTPRVESAGYVERWSIRAQAPTNTAHVEITPVNYSALMPYDYMEKAPYRYGESNKPPTRRQGNYRITITSPGARAKTTQGMNGELCSAGVLYQAQDEKSPVSPPDVAGDIAQRVAFARARFADLRLECPNPVLETLFDYSKIRACDSICETRGGPLHAPGGEAYYAAIWANDTLEYVAPFFPFHGYAYGNDATLNALGHYSRFMNPQYDPLPSSIIAEGTDIWARRLRKDGLPDKEGDCGDAAMLAFGGSRFLLALGNADAARKYWPLIEWSLEYCRRQTTPDGVVASASDELEERFASGKCKLNTTMLTYGGLISGADLAEALGKTALASQYRERAEALHQAARRYFEANVSGFATYQYHEGCQELRAWICMPLTLGILDRKEGTLAALFSPQLWTTNGLRTTESDTTYWDRSTLHALRGVFNAGEPDLGLKYLQEYSRQRLLGEHVPYVIEAFPEGNGRHLSAESALYCRIFTEGLFGIRPTGFHEFSLQPRLPSDWNRAALRRIRAFGTVFDLEVSRETSQRLTIRVAQENRPVASYSIASGETLKIPLKP